jgi:hypothetical protein
MLIKVPFSKSLPPPLQAPSGTPVFIILQDSPYAHYYVKIMWTFINAQISTPVYKYDTLLYYKSEG